MDGTAPEPPTSTIQNTHQQQQQGQQQQRQQQQQQQLQQQQQYPAGSTVDQQPTSTFQTIVLDVQSEPNAPCGIRFEGPDWRNHLPVLKPLGLAMAISRQPRELFRKAEGAELFNLMAGDLMPAMQKGTSSASALSDCVCNISRLIGYRDDVLASFADVKFSVEVCRPFKLKRHSQYLKSVSSMSSTDMRRAITEASPNTVASYARPHMAWRAAPSPTSTMDDASGTHTHGAVPVTSAGNSTTRDRFDMPSRTSLEGNVADSGPPLVQSEFENQQMREQMGLNHSRTNYSQTLMTWFVQDPRDGSCQMFCKAKPKRLLPKCTHYFDGTKVVTLTEEGKQHLTRLVLQWKASGLSAVAYSYRPLTTQAEIDIVNQLDQHNFFCATETEDGAHRVVEVEKVGSSTTGVASASSAGSSDLAAASCELQNEQVLLGMAAVKLCASVQMASYAEALKSAGIRFQVYSCEGEKRTRTLGAQLGLETDWNCLISLEPAAREVKNMMGQVVLPSGIANIRRHAKEVDNVPLLVSLYSKASPWRAQQMIGIMQEHAECVTCVGSALQPNFETFRQANISVSVLVSSVPQCQHCLGRREPRESGNVDNDHLVGCTAQHNAEFQLSADLTSLPCALQARHSFSNGEQRTLGVLYNAIKEARRCVDCILMVLIHYICGAVELAVLVTLTGLLCLPSPMEGCHILCFLLILIPAISFSLLFNAASPQIMKELPLKKADEKTLAQPGRLMFLYALRSIPSALVVAVAFVQDLHWMFDLSLKELKRHSYALEGLRACDGFSWLWWFNGKWPSCAAALIHFEPEAHCGLAHAQQWCAFLFVVYQVTLAFTCLDRYDSLAAKGPRSNKVLCSVAALTLILHTIASYLTLRLKCGKDGHFLRMPSWELWLIYVVLWPSLAIMVSECTKRRDRKYHLHLQKTLRALFNTRLGMWSPK
eukprot:TRINITY_DN3953_c2_g1_i1.p1 TRINITY_DN3953_c2_g1~~TRINITY_DN3953_c2_g1_i1.p1  ORF type:complete len:938 (-),score=147.63 TRINITY_DN3953_c2_g1_i1:116-2929(-)